MRLRARDHVVGVLVAVVVGQALIGCASRSRLDPLDGAVAGQDAQGPSAPGERCGNGMDDDGDGKIDERCPCSPGAMQPCWRGGPATRGRGTCRDGQQICTAAGSWGGCMGGVDPSAEKCGDDGNGDGVDQDCNGAADDGCRCSATVDPKPRECPTPPVTGECRKGMQHCGPDGKWTECVGQVPPKPEVCGNGKDEDCNGKPDDGCLPPPPPDGPPTLPPDLPDAAAELPPPAELGPEPPPGAPLADVPPDLPPDVPPDLLSDVPSACPGGAPFTWKNPVVRCKWTKAPSIATPVVIDLDGDGGPEIVFQTNTSPARLHAIKGVDCGDVWGVDAPIDRMMPLAAGDIDGDGKVEIVGSGPRVYSSTGTLLASNPSFSPVTGVTIADIDGVAPPEIVGAAGAYRFVPPGTVSKVWGTLGGDAPWLSLVADVNLDGKPDVIAGGRIFQGSDGADKTPPALAALPAGRAPPLAAVGQLDRSTPEPEIVLVSRPPAGGGAAQLRVVNPTSGAVVFGPYPIPIDPKSGQSLAGAPAVADFDGDGEAEVGVAGPIDYRVFDLECATMPIPGKCLEAGVLWASATQDTSSGFTSSSVFDFNADGKIEVVYRDECWLRIYSGANGKVLSAYAITSQTGMEEPVIADADGDGRAEIVVTSDDGWKKCPGTPELETGAPWTGYTSGVFILGHPDDCWSQARKVWNQHSYHVTNVDDDGTIPTKEANSWDGHNGYRQQVKP